MSPIRSKHPLIAAGLLFVLFGGSPPAKAGEAPTAGEETHSLVGFEGAATVDAARLETQRAGTLVANDMKLDGVVAGNAASDLVTGLNIVTEGSLTGNSGLTTLIQNSGNNVLIQNATIVNLQLQ
ncbi:MAG: hypothetical protein HGA47_12030 [Zoogloea sp.]|nr:hypothetical protein [Zoogloea sp.]